MATITGSTEEKIFTLSKFMGLNQAPDGDTKLKFGEAAAMWNFRITRDANLQRRPGTKTMVSLANGQPVRGMWVGNVNGEEVFLAAAGGKLWKLTDSDDVMKATSLGTIDTTNDVHFFGFSNIVYMLNGKQYKQWDGSTLSDVGGYRPLVYTAVTADGKGAQLEQVNKLTGAKRIWISPDGKATTFQLPEKGIKSLDYVMDLKTGKNLATSAYTANLTNGTVTFTTVPAQGTNSYEIGWTFSANFRSQVTAMRYSELYTGAQDKNIFLYGDGSNKAIYSGLDYDGQARADYFPDMYEVKVGDENTPITSMIRHYSRLICFKTGSSWAISYGLTTLADDRETEAYYTTPVNKAIGNEALGQVRLVLNAPYTLFGSNVYEWRNNSSYTSNLSTDERQAKRISDRVFSTLKEFDFANCFCWDDNDTQEFYICFDNKALVLNYAVDAWYYYTDFPVHCMCNRDGVLYLGTPDGKIKRFAYRYLNDDGEAIDAYWESGSMSFGKDYMRKYSSQLWVGIKPEGTAEVNVTVQTDRKSTYTEKVVASKLATFTKANFARWSFSTNRKPQVARLKIKAKKFVYYKLIFNIANPNVNSTILTADVRVRFTGYAK